MFRAALEIEYEALMAPKSEPMLPTELVMLTIVFLRLFSTRGSKSWEMYAGPATLVMNTA